MRHEGWEKRLDQVIEAARARPYELGVHDCFRLMCRVVEALVGEDRWPAFAGYRTKREALAKLAAHGSSFEAAGDWFFGVPRMDVKRARRGDACCFVDAVGEKHLGVCLGRDTAVLHASGVIFVDTLDCRCAWEVG